MWIASPHLPPLFRFADIVEEGVDLRRNLPGGESQQGRGCVSRRLLEVAGSAIRREEWHGAQRSLSELCVGYGNLFVSVMGILEQEDSLGASYRG